MVLGHVVPASWSATCWSAVVCQQWLCPSQSSRIDQRFDKTIPDNGPAHVDGLIHNGTSTSAPPSILRTSITSRHPLLSMHPPANLLLQLSSTKNLGQCVCEACKQPLRHVGITMWQTRVHMRSDQYQGGDQFLPPTIATVHAQDRR